MSPLAHRCRSCSLTITALPPRASILLQTLGLTQPLGGIVFTPLSLFLFLFLLFIYLFFNHFINHWAWPMMVITHIVLAVTSAPTPLVAGCSSDGPHKAASHCSDAFPALFTSLPSFPGCMSSLRLLTVSVLIHHPACCLLDRFTTMHRFSIFTRSLSSVDNYVSNQLPQCTTHALECHVCLPCPIHCIC